MGAEMNEQMAHKAKTKKGRIRASVINTLLHSGAEYIGRVAFVKAADFIGPAIHKGIFGTDFLDRVYHGKTLMLFGNIAMPHTLVGLHQPPGLFTSDKKQNIKSILKLASLQPAIICFGHGPVLLDKGELKAFVNKIKNDIIS